MLELRGVNSGPFTYLFILEETAPLQTLGEHVRSASLLNQEAILEEEKVSLALRRGRTCNPL